MNTLSRCKPFLGTYVEIDLQADLTQSELIEFSNHAYSLIEDIHNKMSFHDSESELSQINQHAFFGLMSISSEMRAVISEALFLSTQSKGIYDITVANRLVNDKALPNIHPNLNVDETATWQDIELSPEGIYFHKPLLIDLGGIAKGYAVDCAIASLSADIEASINAGGDLFMSHWQGKNAVIRQQTTLVEIPMLAPALATSANYYLDNSSSVIYPPREQKPLLSSLSYSVFAETCLRADALTKIAYLDPNSGNLIRQLGTAGLTIDKSGTLTNL